MTDQIKETVKERYRAAALTVLDEGSSCCSPEESYGASLYDDLASEEVPDSAAMASLGCGNPTAIADLSPGQKVLDLGSGGGLDVFLSAKRVGAEGFVWGLDMTDEMVALARKNQAEAGFTNVAFIKGDIESIPLPDDGIDVIISNCVINLSTDKDAVFREAHRVLRPGGRFAVTDIVRLDGTIDPDDTAGWANCISGAIPIAEFEAGLRNAGFTDITIETTGSASDGVANAEITAIA